MGRPGIAPSPFEWTQPYPSRRSPVLAENVVAASQPLASQAGLEMLRLGGNAVDAALAAAITLTVVEPTGNGLGSDAFAIVCDGQVLHGLNASGRSPAAWSPERFGDEKEMPRRGWDSVTVPGAVSAWVALSERFGRLDFERLFRPAIGYARSGFPVSPVIAGEWAGAARALGRDFAEFARVFLPEDRAPRAGERFSCPELAETLEEIAATVGESFYRGRLAGEIAGASEAGGGAMTRQDLAEHRADWVEPISVRYRALELHEIPPNGQGIAALIALGILEHFDLAALPVDSAGSLHLQIEAMKLAFTEAHARVADPAHMTLAPGELLAPERLAGLAAALKRDRAHDAPWGRRREEGDTVYLAAADSSGMMVSYIQSNYQGFGSGVVVPGTGITLQNRGAGFSLRESHPNRVAGRKRPFHTIIPAFVTGDGRPVMSFGVMGGPMQPQGHVQVMVRLADYGQNPQACSDAPRWRVEGGRRVLIEAGCDPRVVAALEKMGHRVEVKSSALPFGGAQLIHRIEGGYCAGSDHRKDGCAVGY
jgi:gamma-glutamyltranspeptidase/glutathione hydrolase